MVAGVLGEGDGPVLECAWERPEPPPSRRPEVVWRAGLDLHPLDVTDPDDLHWLECLIWPEQEQRRERLRAAAAVVAAEPPLLVTGDLVDDLAELAAQAPPEATLVVFHTAVLGYVDRATRRRFADLVQDLPGHWIANEHPSLLEGVLPERVLPAGVLPGGEPPGDADPTRPRREGPEAFRTALDGIPVGWAGPHGQFCR